MMISERSIASWAGDVSDVTVMSCLRVIEPVKDVNGIVYSRT